MQCISCEANIPPEWVNAIQTNICPGCGKEIMNEEQKTLRDELSAAMEQMSHDPDGLAGWLLSNYHLRKIGEAEPTHFHRAKNKNRKNNDTEDSQEINENNAVQQFLKRTDAATQLKNRKSLAELKESAMRIMNGPSNEVSDEEDFGQIEEPEEELESEIVAAMSQIQQKKQGSRSVVANAINAMKGSQTNEIHPDLIRSRMAALQKQEAALSGGGGSFRRVRRTGNNVF